MFKDSFPSKPFLAILGTSHTAGDCVEGKFQSVNNVYGKQLANKLGLEFVNLGYPGASNNELLQISNELVEYNLLKNCKLFLLEPRLGTGSLEISKDPVLEYYSDKQWQNDDMVYPLFFNTMHLAMPGAKVTTDRHYMSFMAGSVVDDSSVQQKLGSKISKTELTDFTNYIKNKIYYESQTGLRKINDMTTILSIKNIVLGAGVDDFGWLVFDGAPAYHSLTDSLYNSYLPLRYCPSNSFSYHKLNIISYIEEKYSAEFVESNRCECGHYNQTIHDIIANILYESLI